MITLPVVVVTVAVTVTVLYTVLGRCQQVSCRSPYLTYPPGPVDVLVTVVVAGTLRYEEQNEVAGAPRALTTLRTPVTTLQLTALTSSARGMTSNRSSPLCCSSANEHPARARVSHDVKCIIKGLMTNSDLFLERSKGN
jgi:hypothetical protein